jgi:hypothetical protein
MHALLNCSYAKDFFVGPSEKPHWKKIAASPSRYLMCGLDPALVKPVDAPTVTCVMYSLWFARDAGRSRDLPPITNLVINWSLDGAWNLALFSLISRSPVGVLAQFGSLVFVKPKYSMVQRDSSFFVKPWFLEKAVLFNTVKITQFLENHGFKTVVF